MITLKRPKLSFNFPAKTLSAVDFPMPLVPTKPRTCPGLRTGNLRMNYQWLASDNPKLKNKNITVESNLCNLKVLGP